ncbi:MAG: translation initiation factor IF-2 [bacterium]
MQKKKYQKSKSKSHGRSNDNNYFNPATPSAPKSTERKTVQLPAIVAVKDFAERSNLPVTKIITELMKNGILATINETIDYETASIIGDDLGLEIVPEVLSEKKAQVAAPASTTVQNLIHRPPVVTIMGHVDHGKTTLLDRIREASVAAGESGGITQHISAYQVTLDKTKNKELKNKTITFIDTPGHAAFSSMREHGTAITDIVVLIVAANDGVMPQTKEVIAQAKASSVPVIVAINKIDLPDADPMKVKQQLMEYDLVAEEWGGKTIMVEISAKSGLNIDTLLEMILLQAEVMELKADPDQKAVGVVIESQMRKGTGCVAVVLIENGTLRIGDPISIGASYGKVRILRDYLGNNIKEALPSTPVRVAGLKSLPNFGDRLIVFDTEKETRENSLKSVVTHSNIHLATAKKLGTDDVESDIIEQQKTLNLIIKTDVSGSIEAISRSLGEIKHDEVSIKIVAEGVGAITESDITLARATGAKVIGFRVFALGAAQKIAEKDKVSIKMFDIIYNLIDYIKDELSAMLAPEIIEEELGKGTVLGIFRDDKKGFVAGGRVESGQITVGDEIKVFQNENEKYRSKIISLRREKSEVKSVQSGTECGFSLPIGANVAVGDTFTVFKTILKKRTV